MQKEDKKTTLITDLYSYASEEAYGTTACSPLVLEEGQGDFIGTLCTDIDPVGNIAKYLSDDINKLDNFLVFNPTEALSNQLQIEKNLWNVR